MINRKVFLSVAFFFISALAFASKPDYNRINAQLDSLCIGIFNSYECAQAIEKHQIEKYPNYVIRSPNLLKLKLKTGTTIELVDALVDAEGAHGYSFREYFQDLGYYLVHLQFYEGHQYLLFDDSTGVRTVLRALPVFSPKYLRFITTVTDLVAAYNINGIQIWRFTKDSLVLEWSFESGDLIGFNDAVWSDSLTINLLKVELGEKHDYKRTPMVLTKTAASWVLRKK